MQELQHREERYHHHEGRPVTSNVVVVKKPSGKWRMCMDFIDLNKACSKDSFSILGIDQIVNSTIGHYMLSFMDSYSGYN